VKKSETDINEVKTIFRKFTKTFLSPDIRDKWNTYFDSGMKKWDKIEPWDLWEDNSCFYACDWDKGTKEIGGLLEAKSVKNIFVMGFGHSDPFVEKMDINEFKDFSKRKCVTNNGKYWLEGLILTENGNIGFVGNHDGDIKLFQKGIVK
jgi:hypothetical protein